VSIHSFRGRRASAVAVAAIGLLVLSALPAAAATPPTDYKSYSQNGSTAEANATTCTEHGDNTATCTDESIGTFVGKMSDSFSGVTHLNQVCVSVGTYTFDETTGEYIGEPVYERGCATDLPSGVIRIDSKLAWATLAPTTLTIEQLICSKESCEPGPSRVVAVSGSWLGSGSINSSKNRSSWDDGFCRSNYANKSSGRMASFAGSLDGETFDSPDLGFLSTGRETFHSRCDEG
jgi:hypothetical protein